jgi:glycosyltransferase involved in cell wall biosynthesis
MIDSEVTWRGGEGQLALLMKGLLGSEVDVTLAAHRGAAITERAQAMGVRCLPLAISGGMDLVAAWTLRRQMRDNDFDVVHCHSSHAHSVAYLARRALKIGRGRSEQPGPVFVVSRRVDFPVAQNGLSALKYRYGADVYLAISNGVRDVLLDCGIEADRIEIVRSGIDLRKFESVRDNRYLRKEFGIAEGTPVIGNVAALAPHKSHVDFIRAAKRVSGEIEGAKFMVVGEGKLRPRLEALIDELGMRNDVILTGFREDVLECLGLFDCFVLSSYLEGLCTSIMDAQAMGVPVVATRTGGIPDLVEDGKTGLLAPPRDPDRLADAIVTMMRDGDLRAKCVRAAKVQAGAYDYRHMVEQTVAVYRRMARATAGVQ